MHGGLILSLLFVPFILFVRVCQPDFVLLTIPNPSQFLIQGLILIAGILENAQVAVAVMGIGFNTTVGIFAVYTPERCHQF